MAGSPSVSIITPLYNAAEEIAGCIQTVQEQTFADWEQIIIDDGSQDGSLELARAAARNSDRIRVLEQPRNTGPAAARNAGLAVARGRYIAFLDADDRWLPEKLERQLAFMKAWDSAFSYTGFRRITPNGKIGPVVKVPSQMSYDQLLKQTAIACLTVMLDREKVGEIRMPDIKHEDYALWLSLLKTGTVAHGLCEDLGRYRVQPNSVSGNKFRSMTWVWNIYRNVERLSLPRSAWCLGNYAFRAWLRNSGLDAIS